MEQEDTIDLGRLLSIMIAKCNIVIGVIAVSTLLAALLAFNLPKEYTSQVTLQIIDCDLGVTSLGNQTTIIDVTNKVELIKSNAVISPVIEGIFADIKPEDRPDTESFIKKYLDIKSVRNTQIIKISANGTTPQEAQYIAEHVARNFIELDSKSSEEKKALVVSVFTKSIGNAAMAADAAAAALEKYTKEHGEYIDTLEYQKLSRDAEAQKIAYENLMVQAEQAKVQQNRQFIQIVNEANLPDVNKPSGPKKKLIIAIGFVIGCMIATGYGFVVYKKES